MVNRFNPDFDQIKHLILIFYSLINSLIIFINIRLWMACHAWFSGAKSHFVLHDAGGVSAAMKAVLEPWIRAGRVTLQDIRAQAEYDGYYYNQFLVVNDCLHRHRSASLLPPVFT